MAEIRPFLSEAHIQELRREGAQQFATELSDRWDDSLSQRLKLCLQLSRRRWELLRHELAFDAMPGNKFVPTKLCDGQVEVPSLSSPHDIILWNTRITDE